MLQPTLREAPRRPSGVSWGLELACKSQSPTQVAAGGAKGVRKELQHPLPQSLLFLGTVHLQVARAKQTEWLGAAGDSILIWQETVRGGSRPQRWGTWSRWAPVSSGTRWRLRMWALGPAWVWFKSLLHQLCSLG